MALMDKHKQVKRQRLDRICEGESIHAHFVHKILNAHTQIITWCLLILISDK